jgi:hypothetical protein
MIAGTVGLDPEPLDFRIVELMNCHLAIVSGEGFCHEKLLKITFHWKIIEISKNQI